MPISKSVVSARHFDTIIWEMGYPLARIRVTILKLVLSITNNCMKGLLCLHTLLNIFHSPRHISSHHSEHVFKRSHLNVSRTDLHVSASFVCVGLFIRVCLLHLLKQLCATVGERNASLLHRHWQDDTEDSRLLLCIFNPKIYAPLLWIHHLQVAQGFCSLSPLPFHFSSVTT